MDQVIFREGDYADCMYEVLKGRVGIYARFGTGQQELLDTLERRGTFGEIGLVGTYPRSATAVALEDTVLRRIDAGELGDYFQDAPWKLLAMMRHVGSRLRALTGEYEVLRDTLREAERANGLAEAKREGLWERLARFAGLYSANRGARERLPSAETLEERGFDEGDSARASVCRKGEIVFREGDESAGMYDLRSGSVGIYKNYGQKNEKLLARIRPNSFLGELGMLESVARSATAVVLEDGTRLERILPEDLAELFRTDPRKVEMMLRHMGDRLRELTWNYMDACRCADALVAANLENRPVPDEIRYQIRKHTGQNET